MSNTFLDLILGQNVEKSLKFSCKDLKLNKVLDLKFITLKGPLEPIKLPTLWLLSIQVCSNMEKIGQNLDLETFKQ